MDTHTLNQIADKRAAAQRADREATVRAQMRILQACLDAGAPVERMLPVIEAWLAENLAKR